MVPSTENRTSTSGARGVVVRLGWGEDFGFGMGVAQMHMQSAAASAMASLPEGDRNLPPPSSRQLRLAAGSVRV